MKTKLIAALSLLLLSPRVLSHAGVAGTTGADFLNIPVGAEPTALGGAYSALALNAYAPTWNPGGLGQVESTQLTAQHIAYLESIHYEYAGFVHPLTKGRAVGASVQYLGSGDIAATDNLGNSNGSFATHYGAYALSYGQAVNDKLSLGVTGKLIAGSIDNVIATAYAADFGSAFKATSRLTLAGVLTNVGSKLTFIDQHDALPLAFHLGAAYEATGQTTLALEGVYPQEGTPSLHSGIEFRPFDQLALRAGYRTDLHAGLSPLAGFSAGVGFKIYGQSLSYAWVPMGDLGSTNYFSFLVRFN